PALALMQTMLDAMPRDMQQDAARHLRHTLDHGLPPGAQAMLGEQADSTTRLLSGMQAKLQDQQKEQHARIAIHHYHCDHLGTPMALTDQRGLVTWAAKLDPWGNVLQEYNPQGIHQAIRLPGQHHDRETGLYYNRHRYYDPVVGSYINQDPIGLAGGSHNTSYPKSPTIAMDPLGLFDIAGGALDLWGVVSGRKSAKKRSCKCDAILKRKQAYEELVAKLSRGTPMSEWDNEALRYLDKQRKIDALTAAEIGFEFGSDALIAAGTSGGLSGAKAVAAEYGAMVSATPKGYDNSAHAAGRGNWTISTSDECE
ncbi:hypothetical protein HMPREF9701_03979, partial [Delftia acidovorans CCUG 274B]|uniref:RHS repeat-associated core domain-containing protein n=1 Tax=Delftia acidovorans TaxID=80866 RepID=UPI0003545758